MHQLTRTTLKGRMDRVGLLGRAIALVAFVAVVMLGWLAAPVGAASVQEPKPGAAVASDSLVLFDWRWDLEEYWASGLVFTRVADPKDPIWFGGPKAGKISVPDRWGVTSSALVRPADWGITPGQWYWRSCNLTVDGSRDKCRLDDRAIPLTVTSKPPPNG